MDNSGKENRNKEGRKSTDRATMNKVPSHSQSRISVPRAVKSSSWEKVTLLDVKM